MLTALLDEVRIYAAEAAKGQVYRCPGCKASLILRKGSVRIHHFAHRPPDDCAFGRGETAAHLEAKQAIWSAFVGRAFKTEAEWPVEGLGGDRRADVFVWDMSGARIAFELQHTALGLADIESRSAAYMGAGIAVVWVCFLRQRYRRQLRRPGLGEEGDWVVDSYAPRPFERWIHGLGFEEIWFWAGRAKALFRGRFEPHAALVPAAAWGVEGFEDAYVQPSRRLVALRLWGPFDPTRLSIRCLRRKPAEFGRYRYPGGPRAVLLPAPA